MSADRTIVTKLRELLDRLIASRKLSNDQQEQIHDAVSAEAKLLPNEHFLEALDSAVGKNKSRRRESVYLLIEFTHLPEVVTRIGEEFKNPDARWRDCLVQIVGHKQIIGLAPQLIPIIESDPDPLCRQGAIHSAGKLKAPECLPTLLRIAENPPSDLVWSLTFAFKNYAAEDARSFLERRFDDKSADTNVRVVAAWGLAKLGEKKAFRYLVEMLFDPNKRTPTSYLPGESLRAAQAICDVKGWQFEWNNSFVKAHRDEWQKILLNESESSIAA